MAKHTSFIPIYQQRRRQCHNRFGKAKVKHPTREAAERHLQSYHSLKYRQGIMGIYECQFCGSWHVGTHPTTEYGQRRADGRYRWFPERDQAGVVELGVGPLWCLKVENEGDVDRRIDLVAKRAERALGE